MIREGATPGELDRVITIPESQPFQKPIVASDAKRLAMIGGFGCGKTWTGAKRVVKFALKYPGSNGCVAGISWQKHCYQVLIPAIQDFCILYNIPHEVRAGDQSMSIWLDEWSDKPSMIHFYGMGRAGLEGQFVGKEFGWAWIDEAVDVNKRAFEVLRDRLRQKGMPKSLWVTSRPESPSHWLKEEIDKKKWTCFTIETSQNLYLETDYTDEMYEDYLGAEAQRYLKGEWVSLDSSYFPYDHRAILKDYNAPYEVPRALTVALFVDPAVSAKGDYFTIAVLGYHKASKTYFALDCYHRKGVSYDEQKHLVTKMAGDWKADLIGVESIAYQDVLAQDVEKQLGLSVDHVLWSRSKEDRALRLTRVWNANRFVWAFPETPDKQKLQKVALNEFIAFPNAEHDDIVDSFVGCEWLMRNTAPGYIKSVPLKKASPYASRNVRRVRRSNRLTDNIL